jgi:hypothetical protein
LKKQKPWFEEKCSDLLDQRKQAKWQWLQDQNEINRDNLNNVRHEASRQFRNKNREYLKDKINEFATNSKNKNIRHLYRGIHEFKKGYKSGSNLVKDENGACTNLGVVTYAFPINRSCRVQFYVLFIRTTIACHVPFIIFI